MSRGLRVVAAARARDADLLAGLGAHTVDVDAAAPDGDLGAAVRRLVPRGVDAVVDTANLGVAAHEALRGGGTFVALVRPFAPLPLRGTSVVVHEAWADPAVLAEVVALLEAGVITPPEVITFPLARGGGSARRARGRWAARPRRPGAVSTASDMVAPVSGRHS